MRKGVAALRKTGIEVIAEGREAGTAGIFRPSGEVREGLIGELVHEIAPGRILFEVDGVSQQVAREALTLAAAKLPIKTRFVQRIAE